MADFTSEFWNLYVIILTVISVLGCGVFLWMLSRQKVKPGTDPGTTGHIWDENLQEYNNPLPRWWMMLFYITVVFSIVYLLLYPGLGRTTGALGWSSTGQHAKELEKAAKDYGPIYAKYAGMSLEEVANDAAGLAIGQRIFLNNCAQCHGSDGRGAKGFPNLTDNDWLWGNTADAIKTSVLAGRNGVMPPMGAALGSPENVENVANYVLSLSGSQHDATKAAAGKPLFAVCAACHGAEGKGNIAMGAPNLTDKTWLVSGTVAGITKTINEGRNGVMPAWKDFLGEEKSHIVSAYVLSLSKQK
ncbi:MAG: cytochrome-c oxidase, cbb3-type subunit III [Burkholderiaceae bacterium]|nr:cytochrome-c oxidase, cbb3-type subunit III [Burkholderiaceae bacterium]